METIWQDIRFGIRTLIRHPATSVVALLTLALGIGANTALFSVVNGVLLRPLPYPESAELVVVQESNPDRGLPIFGVSPPNFEDWQRQNQVFEAIGASTGSRFNLTGGDRPEAVLGAQVTPELFRVAGVAPALGRTFLPEEGRPGGPRVVILSQGLWQRRFGSDPAVLGRQLPMDGESYTIIGVMPAGFEIPRRREVWVPLVMNFPPEMRGAHFFSVYARLKDGVSLEKAAAEMKALAARLEQQYPDSNTGWTTVTRRLQDALVEDVRPALLLLLAAVGFVLLIACVNVANLLLARLAAREREIAVRTAIGAGRARLVRQMLTESLVLFLAGGALGLLVGHWATRGLVALYGEELPRGQEVGLDGTVLLFTLALSLGTGLLFGLAPALSATSGGLFGALKEGGRAVAGKARGRFLRHALVVAEVAVALMLLIGAGLLLRSFARLRAVDPGFQAQGVLTAAITLPERKYPTPEQNVTFTSALLERLQATPGVRSADTVYPLPLTDDGFVLSYTVQGRPIPPSGEEPNANIRLVTPDYFRTLGIRVVQGRVFTPQDTLTSQPVLVVNETMAQRTWPGETALGKRITFEDPAEPGAQWLEVVGVVADIHHSALDQDAGQEAYWPQLQSPISPDLTVLLKTDGDPASLAGPLREVVRSLDPDLPMERVRTLETVVSDSLAGSRFQTILLSLFSGVALLLAAIGVYGVISYSVTQRTHEVGIRMALGAQRPQVLALVVRQGMLLVLVGVVLGLGGALLLLRLLGDRAGTYLRGGDAFDPLTFVAVPLVLLAVALLANAIPALRATQVDPLKALRAE